MLVHVHVMCKYLHTCTSHTCTCAKCTDANLYDVHVRVCNSLSSFVSSPSGAPVEGKRKRDDHTRVIVLRLGTNLTTNHHHPEPHLSLLQVSNLKMVERNRQRKKTQVERQMIQRVSRQRKHRHKMEKPAKARRRN